MEIPMNSEIKELERRIELKEQEIFLMIESKMEELKNMKTKLTNLKEK
jgi:hypothetical protein